MQQFIPPAGWVLNRGKDTEEHCVSASFIQEPGQCSNCGSSDFLKHGSKTSTFRDLPIEGEVIYIEAIVKRYKCTSCGRTFLQPLDGVIENRRMTLRYFNALRSRLLVDPWVAIAADMGCHEKTLRDMAAEYLEELDAKYTPKVPKSLGLASFAVGKAAYLLMFDAADASLIEVLPRADTETLKEWLGQHPSFKACAKVIVFGEARGGLEAIVSSAFAGDGVRFASESQWKTFDGLRERLHRTVDRSKGLKHATLRSRALFGALA